MAKYAYPAIFEKNESGGYCVSFPDVSGAYTHGKDMTEATEMAQDVLCLVLYNCETNRDEILPPTLLSSINAPENAIVSLIACDTDYYKRYFANKLINKEAI